MYWFHIIYNTSNKTCEFCFCYSNFRGKKLLASNIVSENSYMYTRIHFSCILSNLHQRANFIVKFIWGHLENYKMKDKQCSNSSTYKFKFKQNCRKSIININWNWRLNLVRMKSNRSKRPTNWRMSTTTNTTVNRSTGGSTLETEVSWPRRFTIDSS